MCVAQHRADPGLEDSYSGSSLKMHPRTALGSPSRPSRAIWWDCLLEEQSDDNIPLIFQSDPWVGSKVKCPIQPCSASENMAPNDFPLFAVPSPLAPLSTQGAPILFFQFFLLLGHSLQSYKDQHRYVCLARWAHLTRSSPNKIMLCLQGLHRITSCWNCNRNKINDATVEPKDPGLQCNNQ